MWQRQNVTLKRPFCESQTCLFYQILLLVPEKIQGSYLQKLQAVYILPHQHQNKGVNRLLCPLWIFSCWCYACSHLFLWLNLIDRHIGRETSPECYMPLERQKTNSEINFRIRKGDSYKGALAFWRNKVKTFLAKGILDAWKYGATKT